MPAVTEVTPGAGFTFPDRNAPVVLFYSFLNHARQPGLYNLNGNAVNTDSSHCAIISRNAQIYSIPGSQLFAGNARH